MPIWETLNVDSQPMIVLTNWSVIEVRLRTYDVATRHFSGYVVENYEGRVSSPIMTFDCATMTGETRSGRRYLLRGAPGVHSDSAYVKYQWLLMNGIDGYKDVTGDYI